MPPARFLSKMINRSWKLFVDSRSHGYLLAQKADPSSSAAATRILGLSGRETLSSMKTGNCTISLTYIPIGAENKIQVGLA
jgi:hypothetical protein